MTNRGADPNGARQYSLWDMSASDSAAAAVIDSGSTGDPATFLPLAVLEERLRALDTPRDTGRVAMIVRRGPGGRREMLDRVKLAPASGIPGDSWGRRAGRSPESQLTVIQADVAALIANGQPLALFGDNLYLDLDLSNGNLPTGSRLRAGTVTFEISPLPHNGCQKFDARFGNDALKFVSRRDLRHRNLRGVYMTVVDGGEVSAGDEVTVLSRP